MITINNTVVTGWKSAIYGMRNPMNSWVNSDSTTDDNGDFVLGKEDYKLALKLARAGSTHAKYRRMIIVYADIKAPLYFWKQFDTYKVGTVSNSCSTMHKIADMEFDISDFSFEKVTNRVLIKEIVEALNLSRELYWETGDKEYWHNMIQLLPSSYNQKRTVMLNYEVLSAIYKDRKGHKLDEWKEFRKWIVSLPDSELITLGDML